MISIYTGNNVYKTNTSEFVRIYIKKIIHHDRKNAIFFRRNTVLWMAGKWETIHQYLLHNNLVIYVGSQYVNGDSYREWIFKYDSSIHSFHL